MHMRLLYGRGPARARVLGPLRPRHRPGTRADSHARAGKGNKDRVVDAAAGGAARDLGAAVRCPPHRPLAAASHRQVAERIARTETTGALNAGHQVTRASPGRCWPGDGQAAGWPSSTMTPAWPHQHANGQTVGVREDITVGGEALFLPRRPVPPSGGQPGPLPVRLHHHHHLGRGAAASAWLLCEPARGCGRGSADDQANSAAPFSGSMAGNGHLGVGEEQRGELLRVLQLLQIPRPSPARRAPTSSTGLPGFFSSW